MNILFICSSNICRSPYAELLFKKIVDENEVLKQNIKSVSSSAVFNKSRSIHPRTVTCLLEEGVNQADIDAFNPDFKWLNMKKFRDADIIIGMGVFQKYLTPLKYWKKFKLLSEVAVGEKSNIPDPWLHSSEEFYRNTMQVIKTYLHAYADNLEKEFSK